MATAREANLAADGGFLLGNPINSYYIYQGVFCLYLHTINTFGMIPREQVIEIGAQNGVITASYCMDYSGSILAVKNEFSVKLKQSSDYGKLEELISSFGSIGSTYQSYLSNSSVPNSCRRMLYIEIQDAL